MTRTERELVALRDEAIRLFIELMDIGLCRPVGYERAYPLYRVAWRRLQRRKALLANAVLGLPGW